MYEAQTLGDSNPRALIHSLWLICTTHFGMRTGQEVHNLRWGDVQLGLDETCGQEYLILNTERQTKTRTGSNPKDIRILKPRAYSKPEVPCQDPVYLYKLYSEKRPETMMDADSPFFLTPGHSNKKCWYKKTPMGINKLYNIMNEMKADAGIENSRITPYSSRKMLIQKLSDEGVPPNQIVQISGHKNVNSLNNYSRINSNQSKHISSILSVSPKATNQVAVTTGPSAPACSSSSQFPRNSDQNSSTTMPGYFMNCHFHGNITFNISKNESHHVDSQSTCTVSNLTQNSPVVAQQYKRIRLLSDSDSD